MDKYKIKTYWKETPQPYLDYEVSVTPELVIFKEWWDPGHDPNKEEVQLALFEQSNLANTIRYKLGDQVFSEILISVRYYLNAV